ncbi:hypothetical protein, partial [Citrobacter freundii]
MHQLDINDKYEKIAILRDEMKKKTSGVMVVEGGVTSSQYPYQAKLEIRTFLTSSQYPYQAKLE